MGLLELSVRFPNLGIEFHDLGKSVEVFGIKIAYYGIIISIGILCGYFLAQFQAKRTGQDTEVYLDYAMVVIVSAILGARIYYVIFSWDYYKDNLLQIFNFRAGGLAIYGGVLVGALVTFIFTRVRKISFMQMADTAVAGLAIGQAIGRWGNFCNREAFGKYTDSLFAMQLKTTEVSQNVLANNPEYLEHLYTIEGDKYIQVHPTFLYESFGCILIVMAILMCTKKIKCNGQLFGIYLIGYGGIRFFIEGLRTDQLFLGHTNIPVSQLVSLLIVIGGIVLEIWCLYRIKNNKAGEVFADARKADE